jgi:hypothetical protein
VRVGIHDVQRLLELQRAPISSGVSTTCLSRQDLAPGGIVNVEGDHKIHVINVSENRIKLDREFNVDFDRDIETGPARPHGVVVLPSRNGLRQ